MHFELDWAITRPYAAFVTGFFINQNGHSGQLHARCELSPGGCGYVLVDYDPPYSPIFDCMTNFVQLPFELYNIAFVLYLLHSFLRR